MNSCTARLPSVRISPATAVFAALFAAYPVLVYFGLSYLGTNGVALLLVLIAFIRLIVVRPGKSGGAMTSQLIMAVAIAVAIGVLALVSDSPVYLRYYPVCINLMLLGLFGLSLVRPPSMIERFARIRHPDLPDSAIRYTRNVTIVWCAFFLINGSIAFYTSYASSLEIWTLYNGSIAYILMACLFIGEYIVRRRVQGKNAV